MKKTPLHATHLAAGAKMGEFAGYDMPLYYKDGVLKEHEWTREACGLFDVSHMGQALLSGDGAITFLECITPSSFATLPAGRAKYTVLTNERGGLVDDLIVTRLSDDRFFLVFNAGCKEKDIAWFRDNLAPGAALEILDDCALIAVQGPHAEAVLRDTLALDMSKQPYMWLTPAVLPGAIDAFVSRVGYTGEDGFEISLPAERAAEIWAKLAGHPQAKPVGLAARDSLRLDMGYCLYGHDIDDKTTPVEAALSWVMGKTNTDFIGHDIILPQAQLSAPRKRVGLKIDGGIAREGAVVRDLAGKDIGRVTSGGFPPTLKSAIAQAYVDIAHVQVGNKLQVEVRGRMLTADIAAMPFVPARTKSMKAAT